MTGTPGALRALLFDYGNTIIPFGKAELDAYGALLAKTLESLYGPVDTAIFADMREASRRNPYAGTPPLYRENDLSETTIELVQALYGVQPSASERETLLRARFDSFVNVVTIDPAVPPLLERLAARYPLGLLSNYPDGPAIRASLQKLGIARYFSSVVVSGDLGYVKPHPIAFAASLQQFGLPANKVLFVGDNWLADVQGAKRAGMPMLRMNRWTPPEHFAILPGDFEPDAEIQDLAELETYLETGLLETARNRQIHAKEA